MPNWTKEQKQAIYEKSSNLLARTAHALRWVGLKDARLPDVLRLIMFVSPFVPYVECARGPGWFRRRAVPGSALHRAGFSPEYTGSILHNFAPAAPDSRVAFLPCYHSRTARQQRAAGC